MRLNIFVMLAVWLFCAVAVAEPVTQQLAPCEEFVDFATNPKTSLSEGIVVVKDGELKYEWYDLQHSRERKHILWSATKAISGMLLGIAVRDGKVSLDQPLSAYYPGRDHNANYEKIRLSNLLYMDTGFAWDEYYAGDVRNSPVISMLFGQGRDDMAAFTASQPILSLGPGVRWDYSTGTSNLIMGVLKQAYGAEYERMPWKELFEPIGAKSFVFERDASGTFVGGSFGHATPMDMARIGLLFLHRGKWEGKQVLPEEWIDKMLTPSPGYVSPKTVMNDPTDGVYGGAMRLNRVAGGRKTLPFPSSPSDMYYALGHHGQLIIVLPSANMVIARTGYDEIYSNKIDAFVTRAMACFAGSRVAPAAPVQMPETLKPSFWRSIKTLITATETDIVQAAVAKWVCSCVFVDGLDAKTCLERSNLPLASRITTFHPPDAGKKQIAVGLSWFGRRFSGGHDQVVRAELDSGFGCRLLPNRVNE